MLQLTPGPLPVRFPSSEILSIVRRALVSAQSVEAAVDLRSGKVGKLRCRAMPIKGDEGVLVLLQDVTDEESTQRMRRQFVGHASHELKTPVAGIQALAETIREASLDDPEAARQFSDRLVAESRRLGVLVGDLLDLSRLEDPGAISDELANVSEAAEQEWRSVKPLADAKGLDLRVEIEPGLFVRGDERQLGLMVRNLLDNAIAYTEDAGEVSMQVTAENGTVNISVIDTGMGIPLRDQARVFERFYRVDSARSRDRGGTGLGLAIVKHVADMHGGRVTLHSVVGEGSTFVARLPSASAEPEA